MPDRVADRVRQFFGSLDSWRLSLAGSFQSARHKFRCRLIELVNHARPFAGVDKTDRFEHETVESSAIFTLHFHKDRFDRAATELLQRVCKLIHQTCRKRFRVRQQYPLRYDYIDFRYRLRSGHLTTDNFGVVPYPRRIQQSCESQCQRRTVREDAVQLLVLDDADLVDRNQPSLSDL